MSFPLPLAFPLGGTGTDSIDPDVPVFIDAVSVGKLVHAVCLWITFDGGEDYEPALLAGDWDGRYQGVGKIIPIPNGYRLRTWRRAGWPSRGWVRDLRFAERDAVPTPGSVGPNINELTSTSDPLPHEGAVVLRFAPGDFDMVEASMAVWVCLDPPAPNGTRRWQAAVRGGELVADFALAGSTKTPNMDGGWDFSLKRPGGWAGVALEVRAIAWDVHGMLRGEVDAGAAGGMAALTYATDYPARTTPLTLVTAQELAQEVFGTDVAWRDGDAPLDAGGDVATEDGWAKLRNDVWLALVTNPGDYAVDPSYGAGLKAFVKEPLTSANQSLIRQRTIDQLNPERFPAITKVADVTSSRAGNKLVVDVGIEAFGRLRKVPFTFSDEVT